MMGTVRCIAIDDEPIALEVIKQFCSRMDGITLSAFSEPETGLEAIMEQRPDIVFLDIEMNDISGLHIAGCLPENTCFIFTTAYMEYAVDGFNLDAVDFLHKPFSYERFSMAMEKAMRRLNFMRLSDEKRSIIVKQEYNNVPVMISDIIYIEAMENYSKIYIQNGDMILASNSLKSLCDMLPDKEFVRVHKSFLLARNWIKSFTRQNVHLINGTMLPVGRRYADNLLAL